MMNSDLTKHASPSRRKKYAKFCNNGTKSRSYCIIHNRQSTQTVNTYNKVDS